MEEKLEPLKEGWFRPRETARYLIDHASTKYIIFLLIVTTFANSVVNGMTEDLPLDLSIGVFLIGSLILSPILGFLGNGLSALMLLIFGKLAGGQATLGELFKATIGASIPYLLAFPFAFAWAILEPQSYLNSEIAAGPIGVIAGFASLVASIWALVNLVIAISEAHRFSIGKALFTLFIPIILLIVLILVFLFVVYS